MTTPEPKSTAATNTDDWRPSAVEIAEVEATIRSTDRMIAEIDRERERTLFVRFGRAVVAGIRGERNFLHHLDEPAATSPSK